MVYSDVTWCSSCSTNVTISDPAVEVSSGSGWNNACAIVSQANRNVKFKFDNTSDNVMLGFGVNNPCSTTNGGTDVNWALRCSSGDLQVRNDRDTLVSNLGSFVATDVMKIEKDGGNIKFYKNDVLQYTGTWNYTGSVYIYFNGYSTGAGVNSVQSEPMATTSSLLNPPQVAWI